jgi:hypothetical protein
MDAARDGAERELGDVQFGGDVTPYAHIDRHHCESGYHILNFFRHW